MKKKPLISIVITYYRKRKFIEKTINSILSQTYKNYELIFVYDDKVKNEINFLKKILTKIKRKKIIINSKNLGVAKARNIAIKRSKGLYIAFIDSDDLWKKNKLYNQLDFMQKNSYYFTFTSYGIIDEKGKVIGERNVFFDANYNNLYYSNFIGLNTVMIHKKLISKISFPSLKTQEDFALWLKLARNGFNLKHLKQSLSFWRKSKKSLSTNTFQKISDAFKLYYFYEKKNFIFSIYSVLVLSYNKIIKSFN